MSKIGEPYYFAVGPYVYGYGNTAEEAIKKAKSQMRSAYVKRGTHAFTVYGPCLDAHDIGITGMGQILWKTQDAQGDALPEVKKATREVRIT